MRMKKYFSGGLSACLILLPLYYVPSALSISCVNTSDSFQCMQQTETQLRQSERKDPDNSQNQSSLNIESSPETLDEIRARQEAYRRWYGEHHHGNLGSLKIKVVLISRLDLMLQMMVRTVLVGMGVWVSIKNLLMMVGLNLSGRRLGIICSVIPAP